MKTYQWHENHVEGLGQKLLHLYSQRYKGKVMPSRLKNLAGSLNFLSLTDTRPEWRLYQQWHLIDQEIHRLDWRRGWRLGFKSREQKCLESLQRYLNDRFPDLSAMPIEPAAYDHLYPQAAKWNLSESTTARNSFDSKGSQSDQSATTGQEILQTIVTLAHKTKPSAYHFHDAPGEFFSHGNKARKTAANTVTCQDSDSEGERWLTHH